jgi:hypothetical protein
MNSMLFAIVKEGTDSLTSAMNGSTSALPEALRISGVALVAIFCVMGLFGAMILLLTRMFPDVEEPTP